MALLLAAGVLLAACSEDTQDQIRDAAGQAGSGDDGGEEGQAPPAEEPPPETTAAPAPEQPAPEQPAPEQPAEDEFSDEDWILLIVLGVLALIVIIGATAAATNHSEKKEAARAALDRRTREISGGARWLHDQGSMEILRLTDPQQIRSAWAGVRGSTIDLESQITALRAGIDDPALDGSLAELGVGVAGLRGALESYVSLRLDPASSPALVENATQTVQDRRRQLDASMQTVAMRR